MSWILTRSGKHFDFVDPQPDQICIKDIAWALSNICRYTGHCKKFYSVAQHSTKVSKLVPSEYRLEALLHDASEAYLNDLSSPLKQLLPDYKAIEDRVERVIAIAFDLKPQEEWKQIIKVADVKMLSTERRDLLPKDETTWELLEGISSFRTAVEPETSYIARKRFLARYETIQKSR